MNDGMYEFTTKKIPKKITDGLQRWRQREPILMQAHPLRSTKRAQVRAQCLDMSYNQENQPDGTVLSYDQGEPHEDIKVAFRGTPKKAGITTEKYHIVRINRDN